MTNEQAIKTIEIAKADVEWNYPMEYQVAFDIAIDCIEKQIPKPRGWDKCDGEYICPHCGKPLLFDFSQVYCHRCGGALSEVE